MRRHADDRARRDDRERRAALDPDRPRLLAVEPRLGRERLPDRLRRPLAAGRPDRRPDRAAAGIPLRARGVHRGLAALRRLAEPGDADRRALHPGRERRRRLRRDPRDDRDDVPRASRAGEGDRRLQLRRLGRRLDRPPRRRHPHRGHQLALDLLRERPGRHRRRDARAAVRPGPRGDRLGAGRGHPRCADPHRRPDARRLHPARGGRSGLAADARPRRDLDRPHRRLRRTAGPDREPADAPPPVPLARGDRREPGDGADGRRVLRDVLPRRPLHAGHPRLHRARGRARVPALRARDGRAVARLRGEARDGLRRPPLAHHRPGPDRGWAGALRPHAGGRQLRHRHPAGDAAPRNRRRRLVPGDDDARDVGRHRSGRRARLGLRQHHGPGGRRDRPRGARDAGFGAERPARRGRRVGRGGAQRRLPPRLPRGRRPDRDRDRRGCRRARAGREARARALAPASRSTRRAEGSPAVSVSRGATILAG